MVGQPVSLVGSIQDNGGTVIAWRFVFGGPSVGNEESTRVKCRRMGQFALRFILRCSGKTDFIPFPLGWGAPYNSTRQISMGGLAALWVTVE